jgi:hypothetical protein
MRFVPGTITRLDEVHAAFQPGDKICFSSVDLQVGFLVEIQSGRGMVVKVISRCERVDGTVDETNARGVLVGRFSMFADDTSIDQIRALALVRSIKDHIDRHSPLGETGRRIFSRSLAETAPGLMGSIEEQFVSHESTELPSGYAKWEKLSFLFLHILFIPDGATRESLLFVRTTIDRLQGISRYLNDNESWHVLVNPINRLLYIPQQTRLSMFRPNNLMSSLLLVIVVLVILYGKGQGWWNFRKGYN